MKAVAPRVLLALLAVGAAAGLVYLFQEHRAAVALEKERDAPVVAPSRVREANGEVLVVLDSADLRRVGLETAALRPASGPAERRLPGEVVPEPERVAALRAPVAGRLTIPPGSAWPAFGDRVSAGSPVAQVSDARPLTFPISGTVTRINARPGELVEAGQLLIEVTDYSRPVVRVAWPDGAGDRPAPRLTFQPTGTSLRVAARLLGAAAEADPVSRRPAFLYRAQRGWPGARPGATVLVLLEQGQRRDGVLVPDSAVVQWESLAWTYVQRGPGQFHRTRVPTDRPASGGWIVGAPFKAGDTVVVGGAEQLLSEEFRARITVGEEVGE
jgi:multidrug efflux pump subunit AcrA (membrane-fusion protein)